MNLPFLNDGIWFPPVENAREDGLLAIGGDLSEERLLLAYRSGIFPWYSDDEPVLWWSPDPRFVLMPDALHISENTRKLLKKQAFQITYNECFSEVMAHCRQIKRKDQEGTWITTEMTDAYTRLHQTGWAWSVEAWQNGELAGGLYGIGIGRCFFGESMFSLVSHASRVAFTSFVQTFSAKGLTLIDCQVPTEYLKSMGAGPVSRKLFLDIIAREGNKPGVFKM